jgi:hypothetical protein
MSRADVAAEPFCVAARRFVTFCDKGRRRSFASQRRRQND